MSLRDRLEEDSRRLGLESPVAPRIEPRTQIPLRAKLEADPRTKWPDPLPGMIPQAEVMPDAKGSGPRVDLGPMSKYLPTSLGEVGAVGAEYLKNAAGTAAAIPQALRHPVATAVGVPAAWAGDLMDLAEIVTPYVGDEHPIVGHQTINKVRDWSRSKIASDAPFEQAGEYAAAVPDLLSIGGAAGGLTRIPKVEGALVKAGMGVAEKMGKVRRRIVPSVQQSNNISRGGSFVQDILAKYDADPDLPGLSEIDTPKEDTFGIDGIKQFVYRAPDGRVVAAGDAYFNTAGDGRWKIGNMAADDRLGALAARATIEITKGMRRLNPDGVIFSDSYSEFSANLHNKFARNPIVEVDPVLGISGLKTRTPERLAKRGRELLARVTPAPRLKFITEMYKMPKATFRVARKYINNPWSAPSDYLREAANTLYEARQRDASNWQRLTHKQRKIVAVLGNFRKSDSTHYLQLASDVGILRGKTVARINARRGTNLPERPVVAPFRTRAPQEPPKTKRLARAEAIEAGKLDPPSHLRSVVDDFMEQWVLDPARRFKDYAFSRPGTKGALAARFDDQPVRRALTRGVSRWIEAGENERRRLGSQTEDYTLSILEQLRKDAGDDWEVRDKLARMAKEYWETRGGGAQDLDAIDAEFTRSVPSTGRTQFRESAPVRAGRQRMQSESGSPEFSWEHPHWDGTFWDTWEEQLYHDMTRYGPDLDWTDPVAMRRASATISEEEFFSGIGDDGPQPPDELLDLGGGRGMSSGLPDQRTWADGSPIPEMPNDPSIAPGTRIAPLTPDEIDTADQMLNSPPHRANEGTGIVQARNILRTALQTGDPEAIRQAMSTLGNSHAYEAQRALNQQVRLRLTHRGNRPPRRTANGGITLPEHMVRGRSAAERAAIFDELDDTLPRPRSGPDVELSDEMKKLLDQIKVGLRDRLEQAAAQGHLSAAQIAKLRRSRDELMLNVFRAAHDPKWIERARGLDSWAAIQATFKKANPTWTSSEINGAIKKLLDINVARRFEESGLRGIEGMEQIVRHPILKHIFSSDEYKAMLGEDIEHLYGKINDAPTALSLAGDVLANQRAHNVMVQGLSDELHKVGLAAPGPKQMPPREGWVDVSEHFGLGSPSGPDGLWVPQELEEVYKRGAATFKDMHDLTRALLKTGARWRVWSTVYSPTTTLGQALSNTFAFSGSGDLYRLEAPTAIQHSLRQAFSAIGRGGQAAKDRRFEMGAAGRGLGAGAIGGEIGETATELGMTPKVGNTGEIYRWMEKAGIDPKAAWARTATDRSRRAGQFARDAFHQGDVIFKKAMASLIAADFEQIRLNATPSDLKNVMLDLFGSEDAAEIAADMTQNMTQSYQRASQGAKDLGKGGVIGLFSSFPYESTRNFGWTAAYTVKYLQGAARAESPIVRKILMERALRSIAGMSINLRFLSELGDIASEIVGPGVSDEQKEAYQKISPDYDKGPMAILGRDKENLTYIPGGNLEYFQTPRRILENLQKVAGSMMNGQWSKIDEDLLATVSRLSDDFLQFHQPVRGMAEAMLNRKIEGSPVSAAATAFSRRAATRLSTNPVGSEYAKEVFKKALQPGFSPTPARQALGLGEWATSPDPEAGVSPREVSPIKVRNMNLPKTLGAIGGRLAEEKNNFATQINKINKELISPQEKAEKIMKLRDDWNSDFGPKVARDLKQLRKIFTRKQINEAMQQLGDKTTIAAVNGRIPRFDLVFRESIPGRVRFYMRQTK